MDWTSKVYDRNMLEGQSYQKQIADKAKAFDNLEKNYVAKQIEGLAADKAALIEYMRPFFAERIGNVMNQGMYRESQAIPYNEGEYVLPPDGLASEYFRRQ